MSLEIIARVVLGIGIIATIVGLVLYKKRKLIPALVFTVVSCWGILGHGLINFYREAEVSGRDVVAMVVFGTGGLIATVLIVGLLIAKRRGSVTQRGK